MKETDIQSTIIRYLAILETQGKLFFNRTNNIPPVNKDSRGKVIGFRRLPNGADYYVVRSYEEVKNILDKYLKSA